MTTPQLYCDDCLERLKNLEENSIDTIITDPPYGLSDHPKEDVVECLQKWLSGETHIHNKKGFMGKEWDAFVPGPEYWKECYRVLKPGGYMTVFAGTRTLDIMGIALRLAGFKYVDTVMYVYGSGFPKAADVSKLIDKKIGESDGDLGKDVIAIKQQLIDLVNTCGKTRSEVNNECGFRATNYLTLPAEGKRPDPWVNILPSPEKWAIMKKVIGGSDEMDVLFERIITSVLDKREVIGKKKLIPGVAFSSEGLSEMDITVPYTPLAKEFDGWRTQIKPAYEPIIIVMKPLDGSYADNALKHGVAGFWIEGCRVGDEQRINHSSGTPGGGRMRLCNQVDRGDGKTPDGSDLANNLAYKAKSKLREPTQVEGRYPPNLLLDGSEEVVDLFPNTTSGSFNGVRKSNKFKNTYGSFTTDSEVPHEGSSGSAARFFPHLPLDQKD